MVAPSCLVLPILYTILDAMSSKTVIGRWANRRGGSAVNDASIACSLGAYISPQCARFCRIFYTRIFFIGHARLRMRGCFASRTSASVFHCSSAHFRSYIPTLLGSGEFICYKLFASLPLIPSLSLFTYSIGSNCFVLHLASPTLSSLTFISCCKSFSPFSVSLVLLDHYHSHLNLLKFFV